MQNSAMVFRRTTSVLGGRCGVQQPARGCARAATPSTLWRGVQTKEEGGSEGGSNAWSRRRTVYMGWSTPPRRWVRSGGTSNATRSSGGSDGGATPPGCQTGGDCWQCGGLNGVKPDATGVDLLFCHCPLNVVQQVSATTSAFSLLGVPAQFAVDAAELSKKHHKMQLRLHPDRFANVESDAVKDVAEAASSAVNEAKVALHDPLRRGLHMLEQQGHHVKEDASIDDPMFLLEVMELNELIEEAEDDSPQADEVTLEVANYYNAAILEIDAAFAKGDFVLAKACLLKLRYYDNCRKKIAEKTSVK
eukprot:m.224583 g.224583  ORF g.224583 m.224583 type:complete len:305 (+) comp25883_c0_seq1:1281-2195(+)